MKNEQRDHILSSSHYSLYISSLFHFCAFASRWWCVRFLASAIIFALVVLYFCCLFAQMHIKTNFPFTFCRVRINAYLLLLYAFYCMFRNWQSSSRLPVSSRGSCINVVANISNWWNRKWSFSFGFGNCRIFDRKSHWIWPNLMSKILNCNFHPKNHNWCEWLSILSHIFLYYFSVVFVELKQTYNNIKTFSLLLSILLIQQVSFFLSSYVIPLFLISLLYVGMLLRLWKNAPGCKPSAEARYVISCENIKS